MSDSESLSSIRYYSMSNSRNRLHRPAGLGQLANGNGDVAGDMIGTNPLRNMRRAQRSTTSWPSPRARHLQKPSDSVRLWACIFRRLWPALACPVCSPEGVNLARRRPNSARQLSFAPRLCRLCRHPVRCVSPRWTCMLLQLLPVPTSRIRMRRSRRIFFIMIAAVLQITNVIAVWPVPVSIAARVHLCAVRHLTALQHICPFSLYSPFLLYGQMHRGMHSLTSGALMMHTPPGRARTNPRRSPLHYYILYIGGGCNAWLLVYIHNHFYKSGFTESLTKAARKCSGSARKVALALLSTVDRVRWKALSIFRLAMCSHVSPNCLRVVTLTPALLIVFMHAR